MGCISSTISPTAKGGVIYYRTGILDQARTELELSLEQFPSAKAQYYLDRVRQAQLQVGAADIQPPLIRLAAATADIWTRDDPVMVSGVG